MSKNLSNGLHRTKEVQNQAITELQSQLKHWENVLQEYNHLHDRLQTLPDKLSYNVMVPFGKLAFMPGQLVHTNEIMVHLGDSWFANMSAKQALGTVGRRKEAVNKNIEDSRKALDNISNTYGYVKSEMDNDYIEIKETVPEDYKRPGDRIRQSRISEENNEIQSDNVNDIKGLSEQQLRSHQELMKRLDDLEKEEELEDQLLLHEDNNGINKHKQSNRHVTWEDEHRIIEDNENKPLTIKFKHSKVKKINKKSEDLTPGDIHNQKKATGTDNKNLQLNKSTFIPQDALSMNVVEHIEKNTEIPATKRPISKFKAAKQKKLTK